MYHSFKKGIQRYFLPFDLISQHLLEAEAGAADSESYVRPEGGGRPEMERLT